LIRTIDQRIAHCFNWPVTHGEDLQVLRYETGGRYDPHYDYFSASTPDDISGVHLHGQRVATVILYLNEPEQGGDTAFVDRDLRVTPTKGNAVFFSYLSADPSSKTLHAGLPVLAGEKWIANKWLRARPF
jgi:prolyl 4-hydroxylase